MLERILQKIVFGISARPRNSLVDGSRRRSHDCRALLLAGQEQKRLRKVYRRRSFERFRRGLLVGLLLSLMSLRDIFAMPEDLPGKPKNPAKKGRALSPEERRALRERYQRFRQLPPEEQERLRQRLREFESLPQDQKETLKRRQEFLEQLTPEQRQRVRGFYQHWQNLPPERRQRLTQRFRRLKQLPPEEREQALSQMPFWQRLDPEQRKAFTDLMDHLPENRSAP